MGANSEFVEFIAELLAPLGEIERKRFFGGVAFTFHGKQFAMVMHSNMYFYVDDQTRPYYESRAMEPFSYSTKRGLVKIQKYYSVPEDFFEDQDLLIEHASRALRSAGQV